MQMILLDRFGFGTDLDSLELLESITVLESWMLISARRATKSIF